MPPRLGERLSRTPEKPEAVSFNVGAGDKDIGEKKPEKKKISKEDFQEYKKQMQALLEKNRATLEAFSGDASLEFVVSDKYAIDFEKGVVYLDATTLHERQESEEQALWSIMHELSHFRDYVEDRKGILDNFKYMQRKARKLAPMIEKKCIEAFGESNPEIIEKIRKPQPTGSKILEPMNWCEQSAYKMYHTFYNCLDDIHVNARVAWKAQRYQPDAEGGQAVNELYREKLFPGNDYAEHPRHMQLPYKLLRQYMVPEQNVITNEKVLEAWEKETAFMGQKHTAQDWVKEVCIPGVKKNKRTGKSELKKVAASTRNAVLRQTVEPLFEELLMQDLEEWKPKPPEPPGEGEAEMISGGGMPGMPWQDKYDEFNKNSPDQAPEGFYEGLGDKIIEVKAAKDKKDEEDKEKKKKEAGKTPEQRANEAKESADRDWCKENNLSYEDFKTFERLEKEIAPYLDELSDLWTKILRGLRIEQGRKMEGHFETGELDIEKVVEEWPKIASAKFDEVRVMERQVPKEVLVRKPEEIRIRLLGDISGSMGQGEDSPKRKMLALVSTLILSSVREFNARMAWQSSEGNVVNAKSQVVLYSDVEGEIKPLESKTDNSEKVDMRKAVVSSLNQQLGQGGTIDSTALRYVYESVASPEEQEKIRSGKVIDIMFEITDGGTSNVHTSKEIIKNLKKAGVITKAFQIGETYEEEKRIFNDEWNSGKEKDGKIVGTDLSKVVPAISEMLEKIIGQKF